MDTFNSSAEVGGVRHLDASPVFVIGHARSGTSVLTTLIRKHLRIAFGTESQFIVRLAKRSAAFGDLAIGANRRRFVETLSTERFFARTGANYGFVLDVNAVVDASVKGTYRSVLDAVFGQLAAHMRYHRWGDKTPEYALHLPVLYGLYPDASFIHVIRDGRDVALSVFERQFGAKNVCIAARHWLKYLEAVERFRRTHPEARVLDVRYEDLLEQPERVFESLIDFLHISDSDGLSSRIGYALRDELKAGNSQKWKTRFNPDEQRRFEAVSGAALERYGYERVALDALAPGIIEWVYWMADDLVRRAGTSGYWRDSLYRLGLRLGTVGRPLRSFGNPRSVR
jgi:hypothetical protein